MLKLLSFFLLSISVQAKTLIISDIDDTIRQTNVLNKLESTRSIIIPAPAFTALLGIFNHYSQTDSDFHYLTAAPVCFIGHADWIEKRKFPQGLVYQRPCDSTWLKPDYTAIYKYKTVVKIIEKSMFDQILLFGDNAEHDPAVYQKIKNDYPHLNITIFIRDIRVEASKIDKDLKVKKLNGVNYFLSENDLLKEGTFSQLPEALKSKIRLDFRLGKLYPKYLYKNLSRRYETELGLDDKQAKKRANDALISSLGSIHQSF